MPPVKTPAKRRKASAKASAKAPAKARPKAPAKAPPKTRAKRSRAAAKPASGLDIAGGIVRGLLDEVFDGAAFDDVAEQLALVDEAAQNLTAAGVDLERAALVALCAELAGFDAEALRIADAARAGKRTAVSSARGGEAELVALAALRPKKGQSNGRYGLTFDDAAAETLMKAFDRLDRAALGQRIFSGIADLRLTNFGAFGDLAGLAGALDAKRLELVVTSKCSLAPLVALRKLVELLLAGKRDGFAPLAALPKLVALTTEASAEGIHELAGIPKLRVLRLTVDPRVPLAGLVALPSLEALHLSAGARTLDADLADTLSALAKRKVSMSLYEHEGWPTQLDLPKRVGQGYVQINMA